MLPFLLAFGIYVSLAAGGFSRGDDANGLRLLIYGMGDNQYLQTARHSDRLPPLFAIYFAVLD